MRTVGRQQRTARSARLGCLRPIRRSLQSTHYINNVGVRASCGESLIPYDSGHAITVEYVKLLLFKADRGAKDFWYGSRKSIGTKEA